MSALTPIAGKLGKLLRLLTSDRDAEMRAAGEPITGAMHGERLDVPALADAIEQGATNGKVFSEEEAREIYQAGVEDGLELGEQEQPIKPSSVDEPSWH